MCVDVERILSNEDKPVDILARWGPYLDQVRFYLRQSKLDQGQGMYCVSFCLFKNEVTIYILYCRISIPVTMF